MRTLLKGIPKIISPDGPTSRNNPLTFSCPLEAVLASLRSLLQTDPRLQQYGSPTTTTSMFSDGDGDYAHVDREVSEEE